MGQVWVVAISPPPRSRTFDLDNADDVRVQDVSTNVDFEYLTHASRDATPEICGPGAEQGGRRRAWVPRMTEAEARRGQLQANFQGYLPSNYQESMCTKRLREVSIGFTEL
jgi:hypothetical protein